jgi:hypothetical protein
VIIVYVVVIVVIQHFDFVIVLVPIVLVLGILVRILVSLLLFSRRWNYMVCCCCCGLVLPSGGWGDRCATADADTRQRSKALTASLSDLLLPKGEPFSSQFGSRFDVAKFVDIIT